MAALVIEAVYENGVLKPCQPLPLKQHEKVRIEIQTPESWAERTAGILGFKGSAELADYFALHPDLDPMEGS